ncbi:MAG TPA: UDP-N-acetylglucosamine 2-epimerase (non-hydrolyzing) [Bryobacteraceae bacterium]|nr:UDP-N-acetylglucosamine 2-epimerase (non-hydrolyzing) [Bryobacteraceae bacterium]
MVRVLFILGTRPEAIKLAPLILHQKSLPDHFRVSICVTGQHRHLLDNVLKIFNISPNFAVEAMLPGQTLCQSSARILAGIEKAIVSDKPDLVVVQGDTTTTICGALASFYQKIPVAHVEAGLRTGDVGQPFPEEMNRLLTTRLSTLHFAPTESARDNLLREGCDPSSLFLTGNSGIDAVMFIRDRLAAGELTGYDVLVSDPTKKLVLVTTHRRENYGSGFKNVCAALSKIADRPDVQLVFPVHPNPQVRDVVQPLLRNRKNVKLVESLGYVEFVDLMRKAYLILTDSGGIQEEGPALGKPILLLRNTTERMEGVLAGTVRMVGTCPETIFSNATELLDSPHAYRAMAWAHSPYGDGTASARISDAILAHFEREHSELTTTSLHQMSLAVGAGMPELTAANAS